MMLSKTRIAAVKGLFYPKTCLEIKGIIRKFNLAFEQIDIDSEIMKIAPQMIIVPHAGYIYSGFTANVAYRFLKQYKGKRIIVIGPSHHHHFKGISGSFYENYETPCQNISIDSAYLFALAKEFNIGFEEKAHLKEHSTEVQMPFIEHYFPQTKIIELIYGDVNETALAKLFIALLDNPSNVLVISSDLSHFYSLNEAKKHDLLCMKAVQKMDLDLLDKGCEACGITGIKAVIHAAKHHKLYSVLLDYKTSADTSNDDRSVVGYLSAMFYR